MFHIRITLKDNITKSQILDYFKEDKCLITLEHENTNAHVHILIEKDLHIDTYRRRINRHFKTVKNQSYCKKDKGRSNIYILKEGLNCIIQNTLYTEEELVDFNQQSYIKEKELTFTEKVVSSYEPIDSIEPKQVWLSIMKHITSNYTTNLKPFDYIIITRVYNVIYFKHYEEYAEISFFKHLEKHAPIPEKLALKRGKKLSNAPLTIVEDLLKNTVIFR
uniref:Uncharacterized protein n=1 Tax=Antarctic circular DNA molecule TaxID=2664238 RepID=A0A5Q2EZH7_9ZZZZ|nr:hypothetical protein [Antarctic circular DNA molecule]